MFLLTFLIIFFWKDKIKNFLTSFVVENFQEDLKIIELKNKSITKQSIEQLFQFIQFKTELKLN